MPAAQMFGLRLIAESAQIDDPADPFAHGHLGEVEGGAPLTLLEVPLAAAAHRVHQVIGDLRALPRAPKRGRVEDVSPVELQPAHRQRAGPVGVAHQAAHLPASIGEGGGQPPTDEASRSGYQCPASHPSRYYLRPPCAP